MRTTMLGLTLLVAAGCAHAPVSAPAPAAVADARPWHCTAEGVCRRGAPSEYAVLAPPPVPNTSTGEWTPVTNPEQRPAPTDWLKGLSPGQRTWVDLAAMLGQAAN